MDNWLKVAFAEDGLNFSKVPQVKEAGRHNIFDMNLQFSGGIHPDSKSGNQDFKGERKWKELN